MKVVEVLSNLDQTRAALRFFWCFTCTQSVVPT